MVFSTRKTVFLGPTLHSLAFFFKASLIGRVEILSFFLKILFFYLSERKRAQAGGTAGRGRNRVPDEQEARHRI